MSCWGYSLCLVSAAVTLLKTFHHHVMTSFVNISCLHLKLFTFDRLIAIKFTMHYSNVKTAINLAFSVIFLSLNFDCLLFRRFLFLLKEMLSFFVFKLLIIHLPVKAFSSHAGYLILKSEWYLFLESTVKRQFLAYFKVYKYFLTFKLLVSLMCACLTLCPRYATSRSGVQVFMFYTCFLALSLAGFWGLFVFLWRKPILERTTAHHILI